MDSTMTATGYANQQTALSAASSPTNGRLAKAGSKEAKLWDQCCAFEQIFLQQLMKEMQSTVHDTNSAQATSSGRNVMQSLMDEKVADVAGRRGTSHLADTLYAHFRRQHLVADTVADGAAKARAAAASASPFATGGAVAEPLTASDKLVNTSA